MSDITIDYGKLLEHKDDIISYDGYLPLVVRMPFMFKYMQNLREKGVYEEVLQECISKRPLTYEQELNELTEWIKENPNFKDLIK